MKETSEYGFKKVRAEQQELGDRVRNLLTENGFKSDAAEGYQTPSVVVCYTDDSDIKNGKKFATEGLQIAAGVPLRCDEPEDFQTFRLGLFGLDKTTISTVLSLASPQRWMLFPEGLTSASSLCHAELAHPNQQ